MDTHDHMEVDILSSSRAAYDDLGVDGIDACREWLRGLDDGKGALLQYLVKLVIEFDHAGSKHVVARFIVAAADADDVPF